MWYGSRPHQLRLNTLGHMERIDSPWFSFLEWNRKVESWTLLVEHWPTLQGGRDAAALGLWKDAMELLELDNPSIDDLMLLAHQGPSGRAEANEVLWTLLADIQFQEPRHRDASRKCSSLVTTARKRIDRPPPDHPDRRWWSWRKALIPRDPAWAVDAVPKDPRILYGPGGRPLKPPACWAPPPPPAGASSSSCAPGPSSTEVPLEVRAGRPRRFA